MYKILNIDNKSKFLILATSIFLSTLVITLSAKIKVPFYPVPMTLQTFTVLLFGVVFGWKAGAITIIVYILEGILGFPVFAGTPEKGIGIAYVVGPTGGYIFGYILTALLAGLIIKDSSVFKNFFKLLICLVPTYFFGILWLGTVIGWQKPILTFGLYPFILGEIFKVSILSLLIPYIKKYK